MILKHIYVSFGKIERNRKNMILIINIYYKLFSVFISLKIDFTLINIINNTKNVPIIIKPSYDNGP